jgi:hypothetical protein
MLDVLHPSLALRISMFFWKTQSFYHMFWPEVHEQESNFFLTPIEQFFSHRMERASYIMMMR